MPIIHCDPEKGRIVPSPSKSGLSDNSIGAIAYLSPLPAFFFLAIRRYNKRPYVRFHAWQSLVFSAFIFLFYSAMNLVIPHATFLSPEFSWGCGALWVWPFLSYGCGA